MFKIYSSIAKKYHNLLEPISEISKADNKPAFISSSIKIINFDKLAKTVGTVVRSPDGLYFSKNKILFLEFKDRKIHDVKIGSEKGIKGKIYEGLTVLTSKMEAPVNKLNIKCIIICNPEKNMIENPAHKELQKVIVQRTDLEEEYLRTKSLMDIFEVYYSPLSRLNINFELEVILSRNSLDKFLSSLEHTK